MSTSRIGLCRYWRSTLCSFRRFFVSTLRWPSFSLVAVMQTMLSVSLCLGSTAGRVWSSWIGTTFFVSHYNLYSWGLPFLRRPTSYTTLVLVVLKCSLCSLVLSSCCVCPPVVCRSRRCCLCRRLCVVLVSSPLLCPSMLLCRTVWLKFLVNKKNKKREIQS